VGRCVVASRYFVARLGSGREVEGDALAMTAVVDLGTTGPLIGRVAELGILGMAIGRAAAGSVQVVAIFGEAGIGKSRLAREGLRAAREKGFRTLESAAGRLQRDLSYAPIVEALRPLVTEPALVEGLSELARLFDGLRVPPLVPLGDPGLERTRMFEAVRTVIERASGRLPLAIFIDDVHWADPATLALLHYLVRGLPQRRCLILLTYRADQAGDELHELLNVLQRAETLTPVELTGLDAAGVEQLAAAMLDGPAPATLRDMLDRRSGGVPLFVKATVERLIETGVLVRSGGRWVLGPGAVAEVPAVVSTLLRDKIKALPQTARRVLDVLAVCGGAAEHVLLADVADDAVEGVTELRAADVVTEVTRDGALSYRLVHPVLAEVAYDMVPLIVRRQLHAKVAAAVERLRPDDVRLLATHVRAAADQVDPSHALDVLTAATRADLARLAGDEACANAAAGLNLARQLGRHEVVDELAGAYAEACEQAGRVEDAMLAWMEATNSALDARTRARRLVRAAVVAWDLGRFDEAHALLDVADHALDRVGPSTEHFDIEEVRVLLAARSDDLAALERTTDSGRSPAAVLFARTVLAAQTGRYLDALDIADELVAHARLQESPLIAEALLRPLSAIHLCWGDLARARAADEEGLLLARQTGVPTLEIFHRGRLAMVDMLSGDWQAALKGTFDDLALAQRVGSKREVIFALGTAAIVLVRFGRLQEAADRVDEARRLFGRWSAADRHVFSLVDLAAGMLALARHELDDALQIAAVTATHHPIAPLVLALLGEAQAAVDDVTGAHDTASRLAALGPGAPYPAALAAWVSGLAVGARRNPLSAVSALDHLDRAIAGFAQLGMPYEEAVARLDRAPVRSAAGHSADAVAADMTAALEVLDRLQAKPQADRARGMLRKLGRRPVTMSHDHEQPRLSVREEEVAQLVAQGLSNAEVAERLFISSRTVGTHLEHIDRRLGLRSRSELRQYVVQGSPAPDVTSRGSANT
jgi:DNA-binding CsgD family transcriptional regulator/tetratricopeptide (TPR) repeat protein